MLKKFTLVALFVFHFPSVVFGDDLTVGKQLYEKGILPNGAPLVGIGASGLTLSGQEAACANCHRLSGMGGVEGKAFMPPIASHFLFNPREPALAVTDPSHPMGITVKSHAYGDDNLTSMIRTGINFEGRTVNPVMPRYALDDVAMKSLVAYLHQLSATPSTGVTPGELHFATVFTPEVDESTKRLIKNDIEAFVQQHNSNMSTAKRHRRIGFDRLRRETSNWVFHFWELKGESSTWTNQLEDYYKQQPVFALVSGVSFAPADSVHDFCENHQTPCLFRSVLFSAQTTSRYNLYFSKGMSLDAHLLATGLKSGVIKKPKHVIQIHSENVLGERVNAELGNRLDSLNITHHNMVLNADNLSVVRQTLHSLKSTDLVVCWCDQTDIDALGKISLPKEARIYFSGSLLMMKNGFKQFTGNWQKARLIYPYELPEKRLRQLSSFYSWVIGNQFKPVNEVLQSDTYISLLILQETIAEMVDNLYKDYLVERVENIMGMGFDYWGMYSRPSLGPVERYANRSGYIVKFTAKQLVAESDRIVEE